MTESTKKSLRDLLGPLFPVAQLFALGLIILSFFRVVLTYQYYSRLSETPDFLFLFPMGMRMDIITLCYGSILPAVLLLVLPKQRIEKIAKFLSIYLTLFLGFLLYMEVATFPFIDEYDLRPDRKFFEYLVHPREVFEMLIKAYPIELIFGSLAVLFFAFVFWKLNSRAIREYQAFSARKRAAIVPFVAAFIFLGARSSLGPRPANISTAAFSNNHLVNELSLNSGYTLLYAAYRVVKHEKNSAKLYGTMEEAEVFERVNRLLVPANRKAIESNVPNLHTQVSPYTVKRPPNIVIFLQESMGASDVGCLEGPPITPNLCRLKDEGLWFNNLYATGTRTVRGIEATVSGFLPTSNRGVVKLGLAKRNFFTAANLLNRHGYESSFIYGGMSNFDEMKSFFLGNGFNTIIDQSDFENPTFLGTWGVSDEDLVRKANDYFVSLGDQPFLSVILSTSNHTPYEFPDGRIELYEQPKQTHQNAIKYADYAIGLLFELAKKEKYFENTIFLIVADHNSHVRGNDLVPIDKFHIPGLIIGPNVPKKEIDKLSSQIDLLPTILHFTGLELTHPMVGRNLMETPEDVPGRAIMQYASNAAYRVEDEVVIMRPKTTAKQFRIVNGKLEPEQLDEELAKDALAYAYLPKLLYAQQRYTLPEG